MTEIDIKLEDKIDTEAVGRQNDLNDIKKECLQPKVAIISCIKNEKDVDVRPIGDIKVEVDVKLEELITEEIDIKNETITNEENHKDNRSESNHLGSELDISSTHSSSKKRKYGKLHDFCNYCKTDVFNFARHLKRKHKKEPEVKEIFSLPSKSKERNHLFTILRKKWNHIKNSEGVVVRPVRRSNRNKENYLPCKYCLGYYSATSVLRHMRICKLCVDESNSKTSDISSAKNPTKLPVFCYFCRSNIFNFNVHLKTKHNEEPEVEKLLSLPVNSKERIHLYNTLCKKSNHVRNSEKCELDNFCCYCKSEVSSHFARHLKRKHTNEEEVKKIFSLPTKSQERYDLLAALQKKGNYLKSSQGCKPMKGSKINDEKYVFCKNCFGYYLSKSLWRHTKKCKLVVSTNESNRSSLRKSRLVKLPDFCYYCKTDVLNFARHIKRHHIEEAEVEKIFSLPTKSQERTHLILILRNKGNHIQNLKECRKPRKRTQICDGSYYPCKYCFGYYRQKTLGRHVKICRLNDGSGTAYSYLTDSQNLLVDSVKVDSEVKKRVFPRMIADQVSLTVKKDILICMYGAQYLKSHQKKHSIQVCSRKMREVARLLLEVMEIDVSVKTLFDLLNPKHYDLVVKCVKQIAYSSVNKNKGKSFTYVWNIHSALKQCCDLAISAVQKNQYVPNVNQQEAESNFYMFKQLLMSIWEFKTFEKNESDRNIKKCGDITILSLARDLKICRKYILDLTSEAIELLQKDERHKKAYQMLMETVFCELVLLNGPKISKLQQIDLHEYATFNNQNYEDLDNHLTLTEKILSTRFSKFVVINKEEKNVILISPNVQEHIEFLLKLRLHFVKEDNMYLFVNLNQNSSIDGYRVLEKYVRRNQIGNSTAMTHPTFRKYLALITQIFNMSLKDIEQLLNLMGHTNDIYNQVYCSPDDEYQAAKIAKLLILMEKGQNVCYKGKMLNEIDIDLELEMEKEDIATNTDTSVGNSVPEFGTFNKLVFKRNNRVLIRWTEKQKALIVDFFKNHIKGKKPPKEHECDQLKKVHPLVFYNKTWQQMKVYIQNIYTEKQKIIRMEEDEEESRDGDKELVDHVKSTNDSAKVNYKTLPVKKKNRILVPWTKQQQALITEYFKDHIKHKQPPRRKECDELKQKHSDIFNNKTWQQMKVYIQNIYVHKKR